MMIDLAHIRRMADLIADTDDRDSEPGYLDTIEGETDAMEVADWLIRSEADDAALIDAIKAQEATTALRRKRIEDRAKRKRRAMLDLLDAVGVKKLERPLATISRRAGSLRVDITDEAAIPTQLCTTKTTTTPDRAAIRAQIEAGETVPGAALVRGDDSVTVRAT